MDLELELNLQSSIEINSQLQELELTIQMGVDFYSNLHNTK